MKKRRRSACHQGEDQYGETGGSQDREEAVGSSTQGAMRGGGAAGRRGAREEVVYQRHVPKFLQQHVNQNSEEKGEIEVEDEEQDRLQEEQEAFNRALEEDPSLERELNQSVVDKAKAAREKDMGNAAYEKGELTAAARHFTTCIELDSTNEIYFSNRSAVYTAMKEFDKAVCDAESVIRMKPQWVKGWARLAVAHFGLEQYGHSKDAYNQALKLEPDHRMLIAGRDKAAELEKKQIEERKHTFSTGRKKPKKEPSKIKSPKKSGVSISYEDSEDV